LADSLLTASDEMSQLIKQVSFVARASATPLPKTAVHMADAVFPALQRLESRIYRGQAVVIEPQSWPVVPGVVGWLEMIWWQLVLNALKHAGTKPRIELGWETRRDFLRFWIRDNGPGVPEAMRGKLFKEFDSLHAEQSVPGLGLSIVQRLVDLQGGGCGHEKPEQGGACFFFTLPTESSPISGEDSAAR
jgi:signal transduction histidine kinase